MGGNWDHTNWGGEMVTCEWIDSVTQKNPVWMNRLDGHMALANSLAMKSANVTKNISDIQGATIVRQTDGCPTGIFKDNAMTLIDDIPGFQALNVIASMQPYHAIDDGRWAEKVIGRKRIKTTYAFRSLLDAGAKLSFGSDWFVAPPIPLEGIYAAVTRRTLDEKNPAGWVPEQKITVEEALLAYTIDAAFASFEEEYKGSLEIGKLADFVVLDRDITQIPPNEIRDVKVLKTIIGGEIIFER